MRTLFLRIFLSFWAAMLLVLLATAAMGWYRLSQLQSIDLKVLADEASTRLTRDGKPGLTAWVDEIEHRYRGWRIYVVDRSTEDVQGRPMPQRLRFYAVRLKEAGFLDPHADNLRRDDPLLLSPLITDPDGTVYTLMADNIRTSLNLMREPDVRLVVLAFALVISGLVCWLLARYVSQPVEHLQSSARSLAAGNLEARVGEDFSRRKDELGVLARDFDKMAHHVRTLIASKESLMRAMSHELRSPLARMRVALGLARRDGADLVKQFDRIELEAERLDTLIGQILQLSQLRVVEPKLPREPLDLGSLLSEIVEDARLEATAADKTIEFTPEVSVQVEGDAALLRSAIENVLRNAVRFTAAATAVTVTLSLERNVASIVIADRGPGVPPYEVERIFEPFYRVAESRDRDSGGNGIGLAITSRVITVYGGEVRARNRSDGGLRVEMTLPATQG
ncbi:MAG: ATP-binding protein [Steroidobacteraceae bacterium]